MSLLSVESTPVLPRSGTNFVLTSAATSRSASPSSGLLHRDQVEPGIPARAGSVAGVRPVAVDKPDEPVVEAKKTGNGGWETLALIILAAYVVAAVAEVALIVGAILAPMPFNLLCLAGALAWGGFGVWFTAKNFA